MKSEIPPFLLTPPRRREAPPIGATLRASFVDRGLHHLSSLIRTTYLQWETANREGFFQRLDARVKVLFLLFFVIVVSLKKSLVPEAAIAAFVFVLAAASRLGLAGFYKRVLFFGFIFGFLIALPSSLNIITPGEIVMPLLKLEKAYDFWIYHIPETIGITREGIQGVAMLSMRVINSLSLSFLVIHTTPFAEIIKALKSVKVPDAFLILITLSYKYIFVFARTLEEIHLAKKGRLVGVNHAQARRWAAGRIAFLFRKTELRCEEVFKAMLGRGFSGDVVFYRRERLEKTDLFYGAFFLLAGLGFLLL